MAAIKNLSAWLLSFVLIVSSIIVTPVSVLAEEPFGETRVIDPERGLALAQRLAGQTATPSALTVTLGERLGAVGFEEGFDDNPFNLVDITVTFRTPPTVALRLLSEQNQPHGSIMPAMGEAQFEAEALAAHETFKQQLEQQLRHIPAPFTDHGIESEILSTNYQLFNGAFMRVSAMLVELIASLDEVYAVTPTVIFSIPTPPYGALDPQSAAAPPFAEADFNYEMQQLFNTYYIHNTMGVTGRGITVAVLDNGVDYNHPLLRRYQDETGRIPGLNFFDEYGNPDVNNPTTDVAERVGALHGTHVTGTVVAVAPDVYLRHYRTLNHLNTGSEATIIAGVEAAHISSDVINMSLGFVGRPAPFEPTSLVVSLAVLDGSVVVTAAGNTGHTRPEEDDRHVGWMTVVTPGVESLSIAVGAGTLGGSRQGTPPIDDIGWFSSRGPVAETFHIKPDIVAPGYHIVSAVPWFYYFGSLTEGFNVPQDFNHDLILDPGWEGWTNAYAAFPGTSMAAPAVAGVAALLLQGVSDAFVPVTDITGVPAQATVNQHVTLPSLAMPENATNRNINWSVAGADAGVSAVTAEQSAAAHVRPTPIEVKARIMNTATPLENITSNCVFSVGAGRIRPIEALSADGFATTVHSVPMPPGNTFSHQAMASLSFGVVRGASSDVLPINITGGGNWTHTHTFNGNHTDVALNVSGSGTSFNVYMSFGPNAVQGRYQGNLLFTNTTTGGRITMPFAAQYTPDGGIVVEVMTLDIISPIITGVVRTTASQPEHRFLPRPSTPDYPASLNELSGSNM